jgi:hypothetical protein
MRIRPYWSAGRDASPSFTSPSVRGARQHPTTRSESSSSLRAFPIQSQNGVAAVSARWLPLTCQLARLRTKAIELRWSDVADLGHIGSQRRRRKVGSYVTRWFVDLRPWPRIWVDPMKAASRTSAMRSVCSTRSARNCGARSRSRRSSLGTCRRARSHCSSRAHRGVACSEARRVEGRRHLADLPARARALRATGSRLRLVAQPLDPRDHDREPRRLEHLAPRRARALQEEQTEHHRCVPQLRRLAPSREEIAAIPIFPEVPTEEHEPVYVSSEL